MPNGMESDVLGRRRHDGLNLETDPRKVVYKPEITCPLRGMNFTKRVSYHRVGSVRTIDSLVTIYLKGTTLQDLNTVGTVVRPFGPRGESDTV